MKEIFFDKISSISIQGPVTSIDLARALSDNKTKEVVYEKKITITLTTQNLMGFINTLNQTGLAIKKQYDGTKPGSEKNKDTEMQEGNAKITGDK
jgi:hypothetical protein